MDVLGHGQERRACWHATANVQSWQLDRMMERVVGPRHTTHDCRLPACTAPISAATTTASISTRRAQPHTRAVREVLEPQLPPVHRIILQMSRLATTHRTAPAAPASRRCGPGTQTHPARTTGPLRAMTGALHAFPAPTTGVAGAGTGSRCSAGLLRDCRAMMQCRTGDCGTLKANFLRGARRSRAAARLASRSRTTCHVAVARNAVLHAHLRAAAHVERREIPGGSGDALRQGHHAEPQRVRRLDHGVGFQRANRRHYACTWQGTRRQTRIALCCSARNDAAKASHASRSCVPSAILIAQDVRRLGEMAREAAT